MPRYFLHGLAIKGLNATLRDQLLHGLAIKWVKCHTTRPSFPIALGD
ncbi:hypothetical protein PSK30_23440 [Escherichia coli]|nr:hypothetical protein [Escherichia coli]MDC9046223.1 hypothetical protein [Escherichia coli]